MPKILYFLIFTFACLTVKAQVKIGGTPVVNDAAMLELESPSGAGLGRGFLTTRISLANTTSWGLAGTPVAGMMLYNTNANIQGNSFFPAAAGGIGIYYWNGSGWISHSGNTGIAQGWSLTGNAGTDTAINFLGTPDNVPLIFRIKNIRSGFIDSTSTSTAIGFRTLGGNSIGDNTAFGYKVLASNTDGFSNTASGSYALTNNTTGVSNTAHGYQALFNNTTGYYNTATGSGALRYTTTGGFNVAAGYSSLFFNNTGNYNVASGIYSLRNNGAGSYNVASGSYALFFNYTGNSNTALGDYAAYSNVAGYSNVAIGTRALYFNRNINNLVAIGDSALYNVGKNGDISGTTNTAVGSKALFSNILGGGNTAVGYRALYNSLSGFNTAIGDLAVSTVVSGQNNTGVGNRALNSFTDGSGNTAVGTNAFRGLSIGNGNTGLGQNAAFILSNNVDNLTCIGSGSGFFTSTSNQLLLGNTSVTYIGGQVTFSTYSDGRIKDNVEENVPGLAFINNLRPVTYNLNIDKELGIASPPEILEKKKKEWLAKMYKEGKSTEEIKNFETSFSLSTADNKEARAIEKIRQTGFIAQEVEAAARKVGYNFSGITIPKNGEGLYSLSYSQFVVPLVKAVQEQQIEINELKKTVEELKKLILSNNANK